MNDIPVIDIGAFETGDATARGAVAIAIARAIEEIGFLTVTGHGIPTATIERMRDSAWTLFGLPIEAKLGYLDPSNSLNRGYTPFLGEYNGSTGDEKAPADLREGYIYGPFDRPDDPYYTAPEAAFAFQANIWPESVPGVVEAFKAYYLALAQFNTRLMRVFATALGLPIDFFHDKYDRHASTIRVLHYPAQDEVPPEGQLRCGAHKDFGSHTILLTDDTQGGLQVHTRNGVWIDAIPPANAFVINIGDLMMMWTNDRWLSNLHRVVNPPASAGQAAARLSVAYFVHPNRDAVIECIPTCRRDGTPDRHNPVLAGEHRSRILAKATESAQ